MANRAGTWAGGQTYQDRAGRPVYVITRMHEGVRYTIKLDSTGERNALAELALFERDPATYKAAHPSTRGAGAEAARRVRQSAIELREARAKSTALCIDNESVQTVLDHLRRKREAEAHVRSVKRYLVQWGNALKGRPLSAVRVDELERLLDTWHSARRYRIASLKTFCTYYVDPRHGLNGIARLPIDQNPAAHLRMEKPRAEKLRRVKGYDIPTVEQHYREVASQVVRDCLVLRAKCGMHATEIDRYAKSGELQPVKGGDSEIVATIRYLHKNGTEHKQALDAQCADAAKRLMARRAGGSKNTMLVAMKRAARRLSEKLGKPVPHLHPSELRHSFVTWCHEVGKEVSVHRTTGVDLSRIAQIIGHRSSLTTSDFYLNTQVPSMIVVPIRLFHPEDPGSEGSSRVASIHRLPAAR